MKSQLALAALLAVSTFSPVHAADAVAGVATNRQAGAEATMVTYCGVGTSEVSPALSSHLKIPAAIGLMVDWIEPGSPADRAGLKQFDVILKFNDQKLVNPEQFRTLVRLKMPSDDVKLELIRQGQPAVANVQLGQTQRAEVAVPTTAVANGGLLTAGHRAALNQQAEAYGFFHRAVPALEAPLGGGQVVVTRVNGQPQTQWADDQHVLHIERSADKPLHLIARDKSGKEIFNGPVETPEQLKALPPELAVKLSRARQSFPITTVNAQTFTAAGNVVVNSINTNSDAGVPNANALTRAAIPANRGRVLSSVQKDTLMFARFENQQAAYLLAFDTSTGKTLFDGPIATAAQRKLLAQPLSEQLELLEKNQSAATEFGAGSR